MSAQYTIKPKADHDLDDFADYLAREASLDIALRFLAEVHETFALLAANPKIGWPSRFKNDRLRSVRVFRVNVSRKCSFCTSRLTLVSKSFVLFMARETSKHSFAGAPRLSSSRRAL